LDDLLNESPERKTASVNQITTEEIEVNPFGNKENKPEPIRESTLEELMCENLPPPMKPKADEDKAPRADAFETLKSLYS
jgi:hypothetical protein